MKPGRLTHCLFSGLLLCIVLNHSQAQNFAVRACIKNYPIKSVFLQEFYWSDSRIADSVVTDQDGCFTFNSDTRKPAGVYRFLFDNRQFLDIVFTGNPIDFYTVSGHLLDSIHFTNSAENETYYEYLRYRSLSQFGLMNLRQKLRNLPPDDPYALAIRNEIISLSKQESDFTNSLISKSPESLTSKLILIDRVPEPDPFLSKARSAGFTLEHFLDNVPFNDTSLLRTNALSAKIISCLSLVIAMHKEADSITAGFRETAFRLLAAAESEPTIFAFVRNYLSVGFQKLGYANLSLEIDTIPYPCCLCPGLENDKKESNFSSPGFAGKKFPDIRLKDGKSAVDLPRKDTKTIVLLSAPGCRWSEHMEKELVELAPEFKNAGYDIYILSSGENAVNNPEGELKIFFLTDKIASRLRKFTGTDQRPLVMTIDRDGIVKRATTSWLNLRNKLML